MMTTATANKPHVFLGAALLLAVFVLGGSAHAKIVNTLGSADKLNPAVDHTGATGNFFDDTGDHVLIHGWDEKQNVLLDHDITVDITKAGSYQRKFTSENATISAGTRVSSHLLMLDPLQSETRTGVFTFDREILGVIVLSELKDDDRLLNSDFLGNPDTIYPTGHFQARGIEFGPEQVTLSADLHTLLLNLRASNPGDQIRVITAGVLPNSAVPVAVPLPRATKAASLLLAALWISRILRNRQLALNEAIVATRP
jgi:hypothetical protein